MKKYLIAVIVTILLTSTISFADDAKLKELYAEYGRLQINAEIIQGQTNQVKAQIAQELQKPREAVNPSIVGVTKNIPQAKPERVVACPESQQVTQ